MKNEFSVRVPNEVHITKENKKLTKYFFFLTLDPHSGEGPGKFHAACIIIGKLG